VSGRHALSPGPPRLHLPSWLRLNNSPAITLRQNAASELLIPGPPRVAISVSVEP
jgi:hypothetical protein